jgi:hypothetical protein
MTIDELRDRCTYWQKVLRLQDWEITVEYVRNAATDDTWWGRILRWNVDARTAVIQLVEPTSFSMEDYPYGHFDLEDTLVHEMLHIYTEGILGRGSDASMSRTSAENHFAEQMCDALSAALVKLGRARFGPVETISKSESGVIDMLTGYWPR